MLSKQRLDHTSHPDAARGYFAFGVFLTPLLYNYFLLPSNLPGLILAKFANIW